MTSRFIYLLGTVGWLAAITVDSSAAEKLYSGKPLRALLITGGCYHNYQFQSEALTNAVARVADVEWTILREECTGSTRKEIELYNDPDWAKPYDIIVHNECFADTDNPEYIQKITAAHKAGKPAVVIHCAMHTYRAAKVDDWREFLGVSSHYHEAQIRYVVRPALKDHPIMQGFPAEWTTPLDELYVIDKVWPNTKALAVSFDEKLGKEMPVIWVHEYEGTRVFGTTYGHSDDTFRDPVFLNYVARGFVWAAGKLN